MRRGILSSMPDDDYLSIALLHLPFNVYATICRATDRQGFLNVRDGSRSVGFGKVSTGCAAFAWVLYGLGALGPGAFHVPVPLDSRSWPMRFVSVCSST